MRYFDIETRYLLKKSGEFSATVFTAVKTKAVHLKMGQSRPLFLYFLATVSIMQIEKCVDGLLGIRTRGCTLVDAEDTTEHGGPVSIITIVILKHKKLTEFGREP